MNPSLFCGSGVCFGSGIAIYLHAKISSVGRCGRWRRAEPARQKASKDLIELRQQRRHPGPIQGREDGHAVRIGLQPSAAGQPGVRMTTSRGSPAGTRPGRPRRKCTRRWPAPAAGRHLAPEIRGVGGAAQVIGCTDCPGASHKAALDHSRRGRRRLMPTLAVHRLAACRVMQAHAIRVIPGRPSGTVAIPGTRTHWRRLGGSAASTTSANEVANIDAVSGGRPTFGIALGGWPADYVAEGRPRNGVGLRLEDDIRVYREVWARVPPSSDPPHPAVARALPV